MLLLLAWWFTLYDHIRNLYELKKDNQEINEKTPTKSDEFSYEDVLTTDCNAVSQPVWSDLNDESNQIEKLSNEEIESLLSKKKKCESLHLKNINDGKAKDRSKEDFFEEVLSELEFSPPLESSDVSNSDVVLLTDANLNYSRETNIPHASNHNQGDEIGLQTKELFENKKDKISSVGIDSLFNDVKPNSHEVEKNKSIGFIRTKKRSVVENIEIIGSTEIAEQENEPETTFDFVDFDEHVNEEEISIHLQKHSEFKVKNEPIGHIHSIVLKDKPKSPSKFKVSVKHKQPTVVISQHQPTIDVLPDKLSTSSPVYQTNDNLSPASPIFQNTEKILSSHDREVGIKHHELNSKSTLEQENDEIVHLFVNVKGPQANAKSHEHVPHDNAQHENMFHENGDKTSFNVNKGNRQKIEIELHFGLQDLKTDDNSSKINGVEEMNVGN
ncbi:uncharacterized protein LOC101234767 isoform X1 [Hydra vulgaris]|uniref:uncharacterized protein LOC101234767 isoform X1 n=1 Tax=Hydra vulgaris TaxID=6087 RepID=UPI001F5F8564|nr:uncharacterized protein LOC101234767 [Hydra vulgaris]